MDGLSATTAAPAPKSTPAAHWRAVGARPFALTSQYLRGLTMTRMGLVLLICAMFTVRQLSLCFFHIQCGLPDGHTPGGFAHFLARQFLFSLPMLFAVTLADNVTAHSKASLRISVLSAAVLLSAIAFGWAFFQTQPPNVVAAAAGRQWMFIFAYSSRALLYGALATALLYLFERERDDARALHAAMLEKVSLDRQMMEARLQVLQAQIEPHFLFNTLANIKLLYETESSVAKLLIHDLSAYLRTALPRMRDARTTLSRELEFVEAYVGVLKVRMGNRLTVLIDVPPELREAVLPPMMLLTLVENAIKHGIASLPQGGTIAICAECLKGRLRVSVVDDGIGFSKGFGAGVGLANTRARLSALYGGEGRLTLDAGPRGGVIAGIELPLLIAPPDLGAKCDR